MSLSTRRPGDVPASREQQELDAVVMLLRGLPDLEPPPELRDRILAEVRRRESRPQILRLASRVARPAAGAAMAAGLAGLAVTAWLEGPPVAQPQTQTALREMPARPVEEIDAPDAIPLAAPAVSYTRMSNPLLHPPRPHFAWDDSERAVAAGRLDARLDQMLNRVLLDPPRFYEWLAAHDNHRFAIARLADRAAERGDATDVALQLRQKAPDHAMTSVFTDELFRATVGQRAQSAQSRR